MSKEGKIMELNLQRFRISLVLNSFFFPLTSREVFDSLKAKDFEIGRPPTSFPTGPRAYVSGILARKRNVLINIESDRNLVGAEGDSIENTIETFREVMDMLSEDFFVNLKKELNYVEIIGHYFIKSDANPFEVIQNSIESKFRDRFQEILKTPTSSYRLSIIPEGVSPSSRNWFEITITPKLTMPTKAYWVEVVFRNEISSAVIAFASNLNSTISNLINVIEET